MKYPKYFVCTGANLIDLASLKNVCEFLVRTEELANAKPTFTVYRACYLSLQRPGWSTNDCTLLYQAQFCYALPPGFDATMDVGLRWFGIVMLCSSCQWIRRVPWICADPVVLLCSRVHHLRSKKKFKEKAAFRVSSRLWASLSRRKEGRYAHVYLTQAAQISPAVSVSGCGYVQTGLLDVRAALFFYSFVRIAQFKKKMKYATVNSLWTEMKDCDIKTETSHSHDFSVSRVMVPLSRWRLKKKIIAYILFISVSVSSLEQSICIIR